MHCHNWRMHCTTNHYPNICTSHNPPVDCFWAAVAKRAPGQSRWKGGSIAGVNGRGSSSGHDLARTRPPLAPQATHFPEHNQIWHDRVGRRPNHRFPWPPPAPLWVPPAAGSLSPEGPFVGIHYALEKGSVWPLGPRWWVALRRGRKRGARGEQ
jgi:hypothetical protein